MRASLLGVLLWVGCYDLDRLERLHMEACGGATPDRCGSACVDFQSDALHCGSCNACPEAQAACIAGVCGPRCLEGHHRCGARCADDHSVDSCGAACAPCEPPLLHSTATCNGQVCDFVCDPGYRFSSGACVLDGKVVFRTSGLYQGGALGGLAGADAICQQSAGSLEGTFKAWLSGSTLSAAQRLTRSSGAYVLPSGTVVADNWNDLVDGTLLHPIDEDELGLTTGVDDFVWTGTNPDGSGHYIDPLGFPVACGDWSDVDVFGTSGWSLYSDSSWTVSQDQDCHAWLRLYCLEQ